MLKLNIIIALLFCFSIPISVHDTISKLDVQASTQLNINDFSFTEISDMPFQQTNNTHFTRNITPTNVINNNIYLFGGYLGQQSNGRYICTNNVYIYNIQNNSWRIIENSLAYGAQLINGKAVYYNSNFYWAPTFASGDSNGWGSHQKISQFSIDSNTSREIIDLRNSRIWGVATELYNDIIYFFGGHDGSDRSFIWSFNIETETVQQVGSLSIGRGHASAIEFNGKIYIMGGRSAAQGNLIEVFNPENNTISSLTSTFGFTGSSRNFFLYPWQGQDGESIFIISQHDNTLWALKPESDQLYKVGDLPDNFAGPGTYDPVNGGFYVMVPGNDINYRTKLMKISEWHEIDDCESDLSVDGFIFEREGINDDFEGSITRLLKIV